MRTKLTPELTARLVESLAAGNYPQVAIRAANLSPTAFRSWMARGQRELERCEAENCQPDGDEAPFVDFYRQITEARAGCEEQLVSLVRNAALDNWQAASWILERQHPDRYGLTRRVKVEVESELDKALDRLRSRLPPETYAAVLEALCIDDDDAGEQGAGALGRSQGPGQPLALPAPAGAPGSAEGRDAHGEGASGL